MKTANPQTPRKKVLIIEDEGDMSLLMHIILTDEQTQLDHVKTLSSAFTFLESEKPDLVLLDNKLPDGFGVDFLQEIKKISPGTKVIMITGYDAAAGDVAMENGADLFLTKPFTKDQLKVSVNRFIN